MSSQSELVLPQEVPELGFYYHYKHAPEGPVANYAYEVLGVGCHTEDEGVFFVVYRPLYPSPVYKAATDINVPCFDARPLGMWMGDVTIGDTQKKRFTKITDPAIITLLNTARDMLYKTP